MLLGHSDDNASQDIGHLRVTYHHNWFDGSGTRHPRVRFGNPVHVYNNYYFNNEYGVASTMDAGVLVEGNYFENVDGPTLVGYADSARRRDRAAQQLLRRLRHAGERRRHRQRDPLQLQHGRGVDREGDRHGRRRDGEDLT